MKYWKKLDIPKILSKIENVSINEGQDAEFICKFISFPLASNITWLRNENEELVENEKFKISNSDELTTIKIINPISNENGSSYFVKIKNDFGDVSSNKAILNISSGPLFITEPTDQNVLREKEARFECIVKSNPKPNIIWIFNEKEITLKDGVKIEKDLAKDKYTLVIPKVTNSNVGTFIVRATNEYGTVEKSCKLNVQELPKIINKLENIVVNENELVKFSIKISGKPKPSYKWFKDDIEINLSDTVEINETEEDEIIFTIKSCKSHENSGTYFVKIMNDFGEALSNKATLTINS